MADLQPFARLQRAHVGRRRSRRSRTATASSSTTCAATARARRRRGPYTLDMLADDLRQLLEAAEDQEKPATVGLSMGGMIGQTLALTDPGLFDRVVLADTGHAQTPETRKQWEERIQHRRDQGHAAAGRSRRWSAGSPSRFATSPVVKKIATLIARHAGAGLRRLLPGDLQPQHHRAAEGDQAAGAGDRRRAGRRGAGHALHRRERAGREAGDASRNAAHIANIEQAEAFNRALREFLSSPASARA